MRVSLIAAVASNGVIGKDNDLIWTLRDDMAFFKATTKGHHVIMGRKNWESIPSAFARCLAAPTCVLSRDAGYTRLGGSCLHLEAALEVARAAGEEEAFIIGGAQIYRLALEAGIVDTMYLTHVDRTFEGDTWFPEFEADHGSPSPCSATWPTTATKRLSRAPL